jgi:hypothetical protein
MRLVLDATEPPPGPSIEIRTADRDAADLQHQEKEDR